jgi:hypothetical protein
VFNLSVAAGAVFSLSLGAGMGLWTVLGCAGPSAPPRPTLAAHLGPLGRASTLRAVETAALERDATVSEILSGYTARKAALARAKVESLAAIDLGNVPCSWKAIVERGLPIPFRSRPGQPPFAHFSRGVLAAKLEQRTPTTANVLSDGGGIVLRAVADVQDLSFYPAHPLTLSGFVRLHASARLSASRVDNAELDSSYQLSETGGLAVAPERVSATVPCSAVALVEQPRGFAQRPDRCSTASVLSKSPSVPLATTPGGRVVARLAVRDDAAVEVLERRAGQVRVELWRDDHTLFGWVPLRALNHDALEYFACHGKGQISDHQSWSIDETARCSMDIPLTVEQGSERSRVGLIRAGTTFKIVARHGDTAGVDFYEDAGLRLDRSAAFVIDPAALTACRVRTPPGLGERR